MFFRLILGLAPIFVAGCVNAHPIILGNDHPANPNAPAGRMADTGGDLGAYRAASPVTASAAPVQMAGMDMSHRGTLDQSHASVQMIHGGHEDATAIGKVNTVDVAGHKVNISHQAISAIGWPAMTMDFPVAPSVDLSSVKAGTAVTFTLDKDEDGMWQIQSIKPASGQ